MQISKKVAILLAIFIIALVLRTIVASNVHIGSDEAVYATRGINIIETGRLSVMGQSITYYYFTDLIYKTMGVSALTSRLSNIIFGALSTIIIFLIGRIVLNNRKQAYIAAFLFAISGYSIIRNIEMDMMAIFFMLCSLLYFIKAIDDNDKYFLVSSIFLGLAILSKQFALLMLPIYGVYYLFHFKKITSKHLKLFFYSALIIIILLLPILSYNYFFYKDQGKIDIFVSQYFGLHQDQYSGLGAEKSWEFERFLSIGKSRIQSFLQEDLLIFLFGLIGIGFAFLNKYKMRWLILLSTFIPFIFFAGITSSGNHYITLFPGLCLFAAIPIDLLAKKIRSQNIKSFKNPLLVLLTIILLVNIFLINSSSKEPFSRSSIVELREFSKTIPNNALVVVDSRVYRGSIAYAFNDKHYIEAMSLQPAINQIKDSNSGIVTIPTYFVECATDDCGWGMSKISPDLQQGSESIVSFFKKEFNEIKQISDRKHSYIIYQGQLTLKPEIITAADSTHFFFFYPVGWWTTENVFDIYNINGFFDKFLNLIAHLSLWIGIIMVFITPFYIINQNKKEINS